jgi:hypothetical protein
MRLEGSFSSLIAGARSSHSQSRAHLRRIARRSASVRFTVALLHPSASFASVISSINARLILSSSRFARKRSSQRSFSLSAVLAVASVSVANPLVIRDHSTEPAKSSKH